MSQFIPGWRCTVVNARSDALDELSAEGAPFDFEATFRAQYDRIARVIARVVRDPARADELAVEVFLQFWRGPQTQGRKNEGWLYKGLGPKGLGVARDRGSPYPFERLFALLRAGAKPE